jgi:hypothetical protein
MNAATSSATKTNAMATVASEELKWESSRSDENMVELEDEVELACRSDIDVDVECPVITGSKSCGQAIIILFVRQ